MLVFNRFTRPYSFEGEIMRKTLAAATAATMLVAGAPAVANAQIVAPAPSSQIVIPRDVTNFFNGLTPLNWHDTEQALKIGAAWILINVALSVLGGLITTVLQLTGTIAASS